MVVTAAGIGLLLCSAFIGYEKKISRCKRLAVCCRLLARLYDPAQSLP